MCAIGPGVSTSRRAIAGVTCRREIDSANRSPSHIEPVSGMPKRKLENGERRLAPQSHRVQRRNSRICQPETRARQPNPRECRRFSHTRKSHSGDRTGWLGWEDSNSQMSLPKLAFEVWPEFPFISERLAIRDFSRLSCQRVTCTPVQCLFCNEYGAPIAPPCGQAMLERRLLWIREFESSHPSQPVRSLLFDFRLFANCRHSRGLCAHPSGFSGLAPDETDRRARTEEQCTRDARLSPPKTT